MYSMLALSVKTLSQFGSGNLEDSSFRIHRLKTVGNKVHLFEAYTGETGRGSGSLFQDWYKADVFFFLMLSVFPLYA